MHKIQFINFPNIALDPKHLILWLEDLCAHFNVSIEQFAVHFIGKDKMLEMNQKYLNHDTHTDILTFDYGNQQVINAELFVSEYMCGLNAFENAQSIEDESLRLISHGFFTHNWFFRQKTRR